MWLITLLISENLRKNFLLKCTRLKYNQYTLQKKDCLLFWLELGEEIGSTICLNRGFGLD